MSLIPAEGVAGEIAQLAVGRTSQGCRGREKEILHVPVIMTRLWDKSEMDTGRQCHEVPVALGLPLPAGSYSAKFI